LKHASNKPTVTAVDSVDEDIEEVTLRWLTGAHRVYIYFSIVNIKVF
jgi:hypothetical protein